MPSNGTSPESLPDSASSGPTRRPSDGIGQNMKRFPHRRSLPPLTRADVLVVSAGMTGMTIREGCFVSR